MKLAILVLLVPHMSAMVSVLYDGFQYCGSNGWICESENDLYNTEMTLDCSMRIEKEARVWIWTARFSSMVTKFTVRNCRHVELHVDCTERSITNPITEFRAIDVDDLDILHTTDRDLFLHDNIPVPHIPKTFYLENIGKVTFNTGIFEGMPSYENRRCSGGLQRVQNIILKNVTVEYIARNTFLNTSATVLNWTNVEIKKMEKNSIVFNGNVTIKDTIFHNTPEGSIVIDGEEVEFEGNTFALIHPGTIKITSYNFTLKNNKITDMMKEGLSVQSSHTNIVGNKIYNLGKDAFSKISPVYYRRSPDYNLSYHFVGNEFQVLTPFSLHCNWELYQTACSNVVIAENKFDCTCYNVVWLRDVNFNIKNYGFYKSLLNTTHHCGTNTNCDLMKIVHNVCDSSAELDKLCKGFHQNETKYDFNTSVPLKETNYNITNITQEVPRGYDEVIRVKDSSTNISVFDLDKKLYDQQVDSEMPQHSSTTSSSPTLSWIPPVAVVLLLCSLAIFIWYLRRRNNRTSVDVCKYDKNNDSDNLIINGIRDVPHNECENPGFHG